MNRNKALSTLGLAQKAGKVKGGEFSTESAVKAGKAHLVILAGDASDNTKKKFTNMCRFYKTPVVVLSDRESLGHAIGKELRACCALTDSGLARAIIQAAEMKDE